MDGPGGGRGTEYEFGWLMNLGEWLSHIVSQFQGDTVGIECQEQVAVRRGLVCCLKQAETGKQSESRAFQALHATVFCGEAQQMSIRISFGRMMLALYLDKTVTLLIMWTRLQISIC